MGEDKVLTWNIRDFITSAINLDLAEISNMTLAIFEFDYNYDDLSNHKHDDDLLLINKITEKIDRVLDVVRLHFCSVGDLLSCPGIPGLLPNGFSTVISLNPDDETDYRVLVGKIYGATIVGGLGLELNYNNIQRLLIERSYTVIVSDPSNDYVPLICRNAIKRLSEAMYIPNLNSKFIYLMTTLETIASPDYLNFKKVKSKILPFVAKSTQEYHMLSEYMRYLSEDIRTEVVHNGKDLITLIGSEYKSELFKIQSLIVRCIEGIYYSGCKTVDELDVYRDKQKDNLGV